MFFLIVSCEVASQNFIRVSADLGNRIKVEPDQGDLIKTPLSPSGSLMLLRLENIRNDWFLRYGVAIGVLGSNLKYREEFDTISVGDDPDFYTPNPNYNTLYGSVNLDIGREFVLFKKRLAVYAGGGATLATTLPVERTSSRCEVNPCALVFHYKIHEGKKVNGFAELGMHTFLGDRVVVDVRYQTHFSPVASGTFNFYHVKDPPSGTFSIVQRAVSLFAMIRVSKY